jgi:hypothetical protein
MMGRATYLIWAGIGSIALALGACSAGDGSSELSGSNGETNGAGGQGGDISLNPDGSTGSGTVLCDSGPNDDADADGYTPSEGDCNDCDPNMNPGAIEVMTADGQQPSDENCNGEVDEDLTTACDANIDIADYDANNAARAIDLCQFTADGQKGYGVIQADYVRANGTPAPQSRHSGIMSAFGTAVLPRNGERMLVISSGNARTPGQPDPCGSQSCGDNGTGQAPPGFPQDVPGCSGDTDINDDIGLEVRLRAPTNANGYSFEFDFYSFEFPEWVCTSFNDQFIALVDPPPMGSINGNISFDSQANPVSVNIAFFEVCTPDSAYPQFPCALGAGELGGTGFDAWDDAGATSWLVTTAPVDPGSEFTIRFAIWDTGDTAWDSTTLIDNFTWLADAGTQLGTVPVPN